jgi:hypothetical protein
MNIDLVLLIVAAVCFALAAFNVQVTRVNLIGLGLLAWVLTAIV